PRPRNPWILFRGDALKMYKPAEGETGQQQAQVSKEIAKMWRNASPQIRAHYEDLAEIEKAEHKAKYPDYKYQPKSKEQK
ncbi:high mobility group box domain-containing protein, partial [Abortiporus biennis]